MFHLQYLDYWNEPNDFNSWPVLLYSSDWLHEHFNWKCVVICVVWSEYAQYFWKVQGRAAYFFLFVHGIFTCMLNEGFSDWAAVCLSVTILNVFKYKF